jgi:DNA mismatch repair protein MutS2
MAEKTGKMDERTRELLEFPKIRERLIEHCLSEEGARRVEKEKFIFEADELEEIHGRVEELLSLFARDECPAFDFPPVAESLKILHTEAAVLEGEELFAAARYISSAKKLEGYIGRAEEHGLDRLQGLAVKMPELDDAAGAIRRVLESDGSVKESHPELKGLRRSLGKIRGELNGLAQSYIRENPDYWQSSVPTQRDGRVVLALKATHRGRVGGVVHYVSSRGATVFIEAPEMLEKNNEIAYVQYRIEEVVRKILRELTDALRSRSAEFSLLVDTVARIDGYYCRARYAEENNCRPVKVIPSGFSLRKARHPILGKQAVPIDIETGEGVYGIIITGPNAGGKTVTLKTVGLFALMNQFGMHLPLEDGSGMAVFDGIFADIGDEQSIEGSVSTFSGHMQSISRILKEATMKSLVLLDELGSGTDPREGAALGMALLDEFIARHCSVMVSSHHGLLKNYGYTTEGVENASMDFDDATLSPNYRVVVGLPGESHALDIASRSGVDEKLLQKAKSYLSGEGADVSRMIRELERKQREFSERARALRAQEKRLMEETRKRDLEKLRLKQREHELKSREHQELNKFLKESRKELENLVQRLKEEKREGLGREDTLEVKNFIGRLEEKTEDEERRLEAEEAELAPQERRELKEGMEVLIGAGRRRGRILRKAKGGRWLVEVGAMKVTLAEKDIIVAKPGEQSNPTVPAHAGGKIGAWGGTAEVSFERETNGGAAFTLDVRGKRLDEAIEAVERQIDEAILAGLREFFILHGKGEGILQQGIHGQLQKNSQVEEFAFTRPEEGGAGKTYVRIKV